VDNSQRFGDAAELAIINLLYVLAELETAATLEPELRARIKDHLLAALSAMSALKRSRQRAPVTH
jgi:hypothetical protein